MKITKISVYQIDILIKPAIIYYDRVMSVFDETIVRIDADAGIRPLAKDALTTATGAFSASVGPAIRRSCMLNTNAAESPRAFQRHLACHPTGPALRVLNRPDERPG